MNKVTWFGFCLIILTFFISVHHFLVSGRFFDLRDVLHHEFLMALFGGVGLGIILRESIKSKD
jgi:hypothetical protein